MSDATSFIGSGEFFVMLPMLALVLIAMFKIDTVLSQSKHHRARSLMALGVDAKGEPIFVDPDGRPLKSSRGRLRFL